MKHMSFVCLSVWTVKQWNSGTVKYWKHWSAQCKEDDKTSYCWIKIQKYFFGHNNFHMKSPTFFFYFFVSFALFLFQSGVRLLLLPRFRQSWALMCFVELINLFKNMWYDESIHWRWLINSEMILSLSLSLVFVLKYKNNNLMQTVRLSVFMWFKYSRSWYSPSNSFASWTSDSHTTCATCNVSYLTFDIMNSADDCCTKLWLFTRNRHETMQSKDAVSIRFTYPHFFLPIFTLDSGKGIICLNSKFKKGEDESLFFFWKQSNYSIGIFFLLNFRPCIHKTIPFDCFCQFVT